METTTNTPCSECQDTETPLHTNGKCGNCWPAFGDRPVQLPIASLREGMMIDLETLEPWLDLDDCPSCETLRIVWECEFAVVEGGEWETRDCYRLDTNQGSFGLPGDILVGVIYEDER